MQLFPYQLILFQVLPFLKALQVPVPWLHHRDADPCGGRCANLDQEEETVNDEGTEKTGDRHCGHAAGAGGCASGAEVI